MASSNFVALILITIAFSTIHSPTPYQTESAPFGGFCFVDSFILQPPTSTFPPSPSKRPIHHSRRYIPKNIENVMSSPSTTMLFQRQHYDDDVTITTTIHRRSVLSSIMTLLTTTTTTMINPESSMALVKGNAPPPKKRKAGGGEEERKCKNVEECQEMAERRAAEEEAKARASIIPPSVAPGGTRYRDIKTTAEGDTTAVPVAKKGDSVIIHYKVLKLGKRSYDGLSGEGTVVFSRGYGLEDDEDKPGQKTFSFILGDPYVITAFNDAIPGMTLNSIRRISILPQNGWEKPSVMCDGGPGGSGTGGDLRTDYVIVPTAAVVSTESCFDKSKRPFPTTYAEERRMAQRFDQSLIAEVELVGFGDVGSDGLGF